MKIRCVFCGVRTQSLIIIKMIFRIKVKVKFTLEQASCIALLFFNLSARWGECSMPHPGHFTPRKTRYPLQKKLGGPRSPSGQVQKILPPLGFDSRTIQPVVSGYTDYSIQRFNGKPFITHVHSICNIVTQCLLTHYNTGQSTHHMAP